MNKTLTTRKQKRERRRARVRAIVSGSATCPRLSVYRSLRGMTAQLIDDTTGKTLVSASAKKDAVSGDAGERKGGVAKGYLLGKAIGEKALAAKIECVVFDRSGFSYHGRVKAVAEGARDAGLKF